MNLAKLIRGKKESAMVATAIPATSAIHRQGNESTVARIATVAVANQTSEATEHPAKASHVSTATTSRLWLIHYIDRESKESIYCPEATYAEVMAQHPDAVAAEPCTHPIWQADHEELPSSQRTGAHE